MSKAVLALYFGRKLIAYINSDVLAYFVYGLIAIAIVASTLVLDPLVETKLKNMP